MDTINRTEKDRILLVSTAGQKLETLRQGLDRSRYIVESADPADNIMKTLRDVAYDLVIVGSADETTGRDTVYAIRSAFPWLEVIAMVDSTASATSYGTDKSGAHDFLSAGCTVQELTLRVQKALEHGRMKQELTNLRQQVAMSYGFDNIVGISKTITKLKETIKRVAPTDITILLSGPTGSGKELVAKVIHHHSMRRKGHFVTVDCSSIPEALFDTELFGEGAHVETSQSSGGLLMEANGGTIFFDDIDRLPPSVQPRLMTFLKNFTVRPAGHPDSTKIDVRVMSATSKNLEAMAEEGCFSKELFYQLGVLPLTLPGLAKRAEDTEMLTEYFLRRLAHEMDRPLFEITRKALDMLVGHSWPGNVRELENTLKRATALCRNNCVDADDILFIRSDAGEEAAAETEETPTLSRKSGLLDEGQRSIIFKALSENDWNFTQTAQELGIGRTTLWRKVKKYNLQREKVTSE